MAEVSTIVIGNLIERLDSRGSIAAVNSIDGIAFRDLMDRSQTQCHQGVTVDTENKALDSQSYENNTTSAVIENGDAISAQHSDTTLDISGTTNENTAEAMPSLNLPPESYSDDIYYSSEDGNLEINNHGCGALDPHLREDDTEAAALTVHTKDRDLPVVADTQVPEQRTDVLTTEHTRVVEADVTPESLEQRDNALEQEVLAIPVQVRATPLILAITTEAQELHALNDKTPVLQQVQASAIDALPVADALGANDSQFIAPAEVLVESGIVPPLNELEQKKHVTIRAVDDYGHNTAKFIQQVDVINGQTATNIQLGFAQDFEHAPDQNLFDADSVMQVEQSVEQPTNVFGASIAAFDTTSADRKTYVYDAPQSSDPVDQISAVIQKHGAIEGDSRITINLHPAELGSIDVDITVIRGLIKKIEFSASKDTLAILTKDSGILEQALREVVKGDGASLSFSLKDGDPNKNHRTKHVVNARAPFIQDGFAAVQVVYGASHALGSGGLLYMMA
jgi:flagellar hook-length control protein FliK